MKTTALRHTGVKAVTGLVMVMAATLLLVLLGAGRGPNAGDFPLPVFSRFGAILAEDLPTRWPFLGDNVESAKKPRASVASYDAATPERPVIAGASRGEILAPDFTVSADPEPVRVAGPVTVVAASERDDLSTRQTSADRRERHGHHWADRSQDREGDHDAGHPTHGVHGSEAEDLRRQEDLSVQVLSQAGPRREETLAGDADQSGWQGPGEGTSETRTDVAVPPRPRVTAFSGHPRPDTDKPARAQKHVTKPSAGRAAQHPSADHPAKRAVR